MVTESGGQLAGSLPDPRAGRRAPGGGRRAASLRPTRGRASRGPPADALASRASPVTGRHRRNRHDVTLLRS
jgi:hypothetical protein